MERRRTSLVPLDRLRRESAVSRTTMLLLMCSDPFDDRRVDDDWAAERATARAHGHVIELVHWESVVTGEGARAVRRVTARESYERAIYRGWMLTPEQYRVLFEALRERGVELIGSPERYAWAHTLPGWYEALTDVTPRSVVVPFAAGGELGEALAAARELIAGCPNGIVVKDFVKSRKHEWHEACFIPDAEAIERVTRTFVERQGEVVGGLVFREFVPLQSLGPHPKSGMPMSLEIRVFALHGTVLAVMPYWAESADSNVDLPTEFLADVLARIGDSFVTIDLARTRAGHWIVMEVGDGQVSGLPRPADAELLYSALARLS
jgi:hypothetical protein